MEAIHLAKRFFSSLRERAPTAEDEAWLLALLRPAEAELYQRQPPLDRTHSVEGARAVQHTLADRASAEVIVAAALHDVGKADAGLGTFGRVGATLVGKVVPRSQLAAWQHRAGPRGRIGRYVLHDERGADLLRAAGSAPMVVAWAREHHLPESAWTIEPATAQALHDADR